MKELLGYPSIKLVGNHAAEIYGHRGISDASMGIVTVNTRIGLLCIEGTKLSVEAITADALYINGSIHKIYYKD